MTVLVALTLSLLIGLSLGLLGGGGSILTVPILVYALGLEAKSAIATSLLVVGITSIAAVVPHARAGRVRWRTGVTFGVAGMLGAYAAGLVAHYIPATILLVAFAVMMLVTAVAMMRGRRSGPNAEQIAGSRELPVVTVLVEGLLVGAVTGLVGAGGGFLVVPALVLLGGIPMSTAVGTSLVVIAMKSLAGFAGYLGHVEVDWTLAVVVSSSAVVGSIVGSKLAGIVPQEALRRGFAWFVLAMGTFMIARQLPEALGLEVDWAEVAVTLGPYVLVMTLSGMIAYRLGRNHAIRRPAAR
jgi:uncharacterized protein